MSYHYTYALMDLDKNMKNISNRPDKKIYDSDSRKNLLEQVNTSVSNNNSDNTKTINRQ